MTTIKDYASFLERKAQFSGESGFKPLWMPDYLFDFQKALVEWAIRKGRAAIFADCGLGKTPMALTWAENVVRKTNKPVLIATPLAVSYQTLGEAEKFHVDCVRSSGGSVPAGARVVVTNYERLDRFDSTQFSGMVSDESSILKNFDGTRKKLVTEFMRKLPYRLLCTATAAPNDYVELGTSSEALGEMGHMDMLSMFFKNDANNAQDGRLYGKAMQWRFKHHAEHAFWRWVCSWARACRRPSDLGFDDGRFILPELNEREHIIRTSKKRDGWLFSVPAVGLQEEREERRITIEERCSMVAELANHDRQVLVWCHLNPEGDILEKLIKGAKQVAGSDSDDEKEETLIAFAKGELRALVTKPKIGAWGLNLQRCNHVTSFPSHSYEQYYQGVRRCWRFGQTKPVTVDIVATEGEHNVMANLQRKSQAADRMFTALVSHMNDSLRINTINNYTTPEEIPIWLSATKP